MRFEKILLLINVSEQKDLLDLKTIIHKYITESSGYPVSNRPDRYFSKLNESHGFSPHEGRHLCIRRNRVSGEP